MINYVQLLKLVSKKLEREATDKLKTRYLISLRLEFLHVASEMQCLRQWTHSLNIFNFINSDKIDLSCLAIAVRVGDRAYEPCSKISFAPRELP